MAEKKSSDNTILFRIIADLVTQTRLHGDDASHLFGPICELNINIYRLCLVVAGRCSMTAARRPDKKAKREVQVTLGGPLIIRAS